MQGDCGFGPWPALDIEVQSGGGLPSSVIRWLSYACTWRPYAATRAKRLIFPVRKRANASWPMPLA